MQFLPLAHEAPEAYRLLHAELFCERFESCAVGPGPGDIQFDVGPLLSRHGQGPNRNIHALVAPQASYIKERWRRRARDGGVGSEGIRVDAGPDHGDPIPGDSPSHEVLSGTGADGVEY